MFALVLFVCYLDGGCEDIVVDVYDTERQCLYYMDDQRIRQGGCFPVEDFIDGFWARPAIQRLLITVVVPALTRRRIPLPYRCSADCRCLHVDATAYGQTRNGQRRR